MANSILFLGKFHKDLLSLEAKIISLDNKELRKKQDSLQYPDVIKYPKSKKNDFDAWIILGDVKPTLLLKDLITKVKIILLVFNLSQPLRNETLEFLNEGWGPIFERIPNDQNNQLRYLVGLQSPDDIYQDKNILKQIRSTMKKFDCTRYFDDKISKDKQIKNFTIYSNLQQNLFKSKSKKISSTNQKSYDDDDDDNDDNSLKYEEDQKEQINSNKNDKSIKYALFETSKRRIAEIIKSPNVKGDVIIPKKISYKSEDYLIKKIWEGAFANTKELESLSFEHGSKVKRIENSVFKNSSIQKFSIPSDKVIFDNFWCKGADNLNVIKLNKKCKKYSILENCLICTKNRIKKDENENEKNVLSNIILFVPRNFEGEFVLPENITRIAHYSFSHCNELCSFKSENKSLKIINSYAFEGCQNLKSIVIKNAAELILGDFCFANSEKLESVEFQCNKLVFGKDCFSNCPCFNSISFKNVSKIKFKPKELRKSSTIAQKVKNDTSEIIEVMPDFVKKSSSLKSFVLSSQKEIIITKDIFECCKSLKTIKLESSSNLSLECSCFNETNIETIEIIGKSVALNYDCFDSGSEVRLFNGFNDKMENLEEINITAEKVFVGENCFKESSIKKFIVISSNEVTLGKSAFENCKKFEEVKISATSKTIIGKKCFKKCSLLKTKIIPENAIYLK